MLKCLRVFTFALVFMALSAGAAFAQDASAYCGELADADCSILNASQSAMQEVSSGSSQLQFSLLLSDIPELPLQEVGVAYSQQSLFSMSEDASSLVSELQSITPLERQEMLMDPEVLASVVSQLVMGMSSQVDMQLALSEEVANFLAQESGIPVPTELAFGFVLLDGVLYLDLDSLAEVVPELSMFGGWLGFEVSPLLDMALQDGATSGLSDQDLQAAGNAFASANFGSSGPLVASLGVVDPTGMVTQFVNVERVEDEDLNGNELAVFRTTFDYTTFFASPLFRSLVEMAMQDESISGGAPVDEASIDQVTGMAATFGPMLLSNLNLELVEGIGMENGYLYATSFLLDWDLSNLVQMAGMAAGFGVDLPPIDPNAQPLIHVELLSLSDDINSDVDISVPEGATIVPIEALMSMSGS